MVRPGFRLTEDNVDDVVAVCSRLDGMPLAIELAAARAKVLSPHAILSRLDRSLELSSTELGRPTRQRTLRQTIAWSVDLLTEDQQKFFRHFGVYGSSCDLEALAAIADISGDPLDQVAELVDVSLLTILDDPAGEPRVTLLQTVRAYARELLRSFGEWESTARRHAEYYADVMSDLMPRLRTTEYLTTRDRIETELGNVRSALEWSLSIDGSDTGDVMLGFRICHEMSWFWYACGYADEGRRWLERATERMVAEGPEEMAVLHGLGVILLQQGEPAAAQQLLLRCLDYWRAQGDDRESARELNSLGVTYRNLGDHEHARPLFEEGIARARRSGDKERLASLYCNLGLLETDIGSPIEAIEALDRALALDRELGDSWAEACDRVNLAAARLGAGQLQKATEELRSVARDVLALNDDDLTVSTIEVLAMVRAESGDVRRSGRLFGAAEAVREQAGLPRPMVDAAQLNRWMSKPMSEVDDSTWRTFVSEGRRLSREEAIGEGVDAVTSTPPDAIEDVAAAATPRRPLDALDAAPSQAESS
jgi:predicted ATPase